MTEIEKRILTRSGWDDVTKLGLMVFDVKTSKGFNIAHIISEVSSEEIKVKYSYPNINGENISISFNREKQALNKIGTDTEILKNNSLSDFLTMVSILTKKSKGVYTSPAKVLKA